MLAFLLGLFVGMVIWHLWLSIALVDKLKNSVMTLDKYNRIIYVPKITPLDHLENETILSTLVRIYAELNMLLDSEDLTPPAVRDFITTALYLLLQAHEVLQEREKADADQRQ